MSVKTNESTIEQPTDEEGAQATRGYINDVISHLELVRPLTDRLVDYGGDDWHFKGQRALGERVQKYVQTALEFARTYSERLKQAGH